MNGRVTWAPWRVSVMLPRMIRPFAVWIRHTQVAIPFATTWVTATARLPASVAGQTTTPERTGPLVSFSVAASDTENVRPALGASGRL